MLTTLRIKNLALVADSRSNGSPATTSSPAKPARASPSSSAPSTWSWENAPTARSSAAASDAARSRRCSTSPLCAAAQAFLEDNGLEPCEDNQLVLKRAFTAAGTNRQFINGSPTTLGVLAELGQWLVDIHGPHDHQSLLHAARQLAILDAFGGLAEQRDAFGAIVRRRDALAAEKAALIVDEKTYAQQLDLLRFQVHEISAARLQPDEETQVQQDYQRASNAARLIELSQTALNVLSEHENSLLAQAGSLGRTLLELQRR